MKRIYANSRTIRELLRGAMFNIEILPRTILRQQKQGLMHDLLTGQVRVDGNTETAHDSKP